MVIDSQLVSPEKKKKNLKMYRDELTMRPNVSLKSAQERLGPFHCSQIWSLPLAGKQLRNRQRCLFTFSTSQSYKTVVAFMGHN